MGELDDLAKAVEDRSRAIPYARAVRAATSGAGIGLRSRILWLVLVVWSLAVGAVVAFLILSAAFSPMSMADVQGNEQYPWLANQAVSDSSDLGPMTRHRKITSAVEASLCLGLGWGLVALPLGIAAVVTMETRRR